MVYVENGQKWIFTFALRQHSAYLVICTVRAVTPLLGGTKYQFLQSTQMQHHQTHLFCCTIAHKEKMEKLHFIS